MATWNNIPLAKIDPVFLSQLNSLKEQARRIYIATLSGSDTLGTPVPSSEPDPNNQRRWQMPTSWYWDGNLFSITGITGIRAAYIRDCPNALYMRALTKDRYALPNACGPQAPQGYAIQAPAGEGRVADCQAEKIQIDYLAIQERAFRLRHATSPRCSIHAAVRRRGHSAWNDTDNYSDLGAGYGPQDGDITGPNGGVFTNMIKYLLLIIQGGYNEGSVDIRHGPTTIIQVIDGTVRGVET